MRTIYILVILVLLALAVPAAPAHAGGVVTVCDEAHLLAALAGGGTVTFSCSGTITLTAEIVIAADTTIDGSGQDVTISGNNAVRVFTVNSGVTFNLDTLTVSNGNANIGGGIFVDDNATLTVSDSVFSGNTASGWGGGVYGGAIHNRGALTVSGSTFSDSSAGDGGGIYNAGGAVILNDSTFTDNSARWYLGGGIYNHWGSMTVEGCTFSGNTSYYGAGIQNGDGGWLTIRNSTFFDNIAYPSGGAGGAIANENMLTVSDSTFSGNTAWDGGGIRNYAGVLTVSGSTFSGNSAGQLAGGIYGGSALTATNCTFVGNNAGELGGGILGGPMIVTNSTFSGNRAYAGGGIYSWGNDLIVTNSTFSGNRANEGGGIYQASFGAGTLKNTIIANSSMGDNCSGLFVNGGGNLSYPDTSCPGINADPMLGPLQDNGGPTWTMALGEGSAALDAGDDVICAAPPVNNLDQRGVTRPQGIHCDIGAFEQIQEPSAVSVSALRAQSLPGTITPAMIAGLLLLVLVAVGVRRRQRHMI